MNGIELQRDKWIINYQSEGNRQVKLMMACNEEVEQVKDMSNKVQRQGPKAKKQMTHIYKIIILPDNEWGEENAMKNTTPRVEDWLTQVTISGMGGAYPHYINQEPKEL
jgi:hypothetical protein